ncbi:MAG: S8 family serine peptidase [Myxococcales bacterium]|jgi:hypothetical protein
MKRHLVVKLNAAGAPQLPFWGRVLDDKTGVPTTLLPSVDRVLKRAQIPCWVTLEYPPASERWTRDEIDAGLNRIYRLVLRDDRTLPPDLVESIRLLPEVEYARLSKVAITELPRSLARSDRRTDRESREAIGVPQAHRITRGNPDVTVAVLDTGIDEEHPDLASALLHGKGRDFVNIIDGADRFLGDYLDMDTEPVDHWVGHGTHVAGIIAGKGLGMPAGVAPDCRILNVRVLGAMRDGDRAVGAGLVDNINTAVKWTVDQGVDVINMSLGIRHQGGGLPYREVVDYAEKKGVSIVAASGNNGARDLYYPGAFPFVITVGALDHAGHVAAFSTYGKQVDVLAPGTDIYSSFLRGGYAFSSGTSHAAPFVAGTVALLESLARDRGRRLRDPQIKRVLARTCDRLDRRFKHPTAGYGRLNVPDALRLLSHWLN